MLGRIVPAVVLGATAFLAAGTAASAAPLGSCSTIGLTPASARYKVVGIAASGVPCTKARSVAQKVAAELSRGAPLSLSGGILGFAINETTCGGCKPATQVALTYATGKVTISLGAKTPQSTAPTPVEPSGSGPLIQA
jgi:hypothetical protein